MSSNPQKRALRINVDLSAIQHNLDLARKRSGGQKLFAVIKADAYGHGAVPVAKALTAADGFAVVTLAEAMELRDAAITQPILVLQSAHNQTECELFAPNNLWPVIHCVEQLRWFAQLSNASELQAWLKIDTGMGRLGFQVEQARKLLASDCGINWFGAMTHFASADEPDQPQTGQQIQTFNGVTQALNVQKSLANSAAVLAWPASKADWARPGIMLYGSNPIQGGATENGSLRAVMRVSAPLIAVKRYEKGDSIGYAASYVCSKPMTIGYLGIGYGDGLPRVLDQSASVHLHGQTCPIVGRVSMDSIAIDLCGVTHANVGDEVVLWGAEHPVEVLANAANTISYELLTSIRGPRTYI